MCSAATGVLDERALMLLFLTVERWAGITLSTSPSIVANVKQAELPQNLWANVECGTTNATELLQTIRRGLCLASLDDNAPTTATHPTVLQVSTLMT